MRVTSLPPLLEQSSNCLHRTSPLLIMLFSMGVPSSAPPCPCHSPDTKTILSGSDMSAVTLAPCLFFTSTSILFRLFRGFKSEGKTSSLVRPLSTTQEGLNHMIGSSTCRQISISTNLPQRKLSEECVKPLAFPAPRREEQHLEKL